MKLGLIEHARRWLSRNVPLRERTIFMATHIHVHAFLDGDATATTTANGFVVTLPVRIPIRTTANKSTLEFDYPKNHGDDLHDLIARLKKDRPIELISRLDGNGSKLVAEYVRIERIDYMLKTSGAGANETLPILLRAE